MKKLLLLFCVAMLSIAASAEIFTGTTTHAVMKDNSDASWGKWVSVEMPFTIDTESNLISIQSEDAQYLKILSNHSASYEWGELLSIPCYSLVEEEYCLLEIYSYKTGLKVIKIVYSRISVKYKVVFN